MKKEGTLVHPLVEEHEDSAAAFEMLLDALGASAVQPIVQARIETPSPTGALTPLSIAHALAVALPENAILVDESLTTGRESMGHTMGALPHDLINNMGGSIGYGTPVATRSLRPTTSRNPFEPSKSAHRGSSPIAPIGSNWIRHSIPFRFPSPATPMIFNRSTAAVSRSNSTPPEPPATEKP